MKKTISIIVSFFVILTFLTGCTTKADKQKAEKITEYLKSNLTFSGEEVEEITSDTDYTDGKSAQHKYFISFYPDGSARVSDYYCIYVTKTGEIDGADSHNYYDTEKVDVMAKGNDKFILKLSTGEYELFADENNKVTSITYKEVSLYKSGFVDLKDE